MNKFSVGNTVVSHDGIVGTVVHCNEEQVSIEDILGYISIHNSSKLSLLGPEGKPVEVDLEVDYEKMVNKLMKDPAVIRSTLTDRHVDLIHATMGICGEAGELLDAIKKHVIYGKELDVENVTEELGDLNFYVTRLMYILGITRESVIDHNMAKLNKRYVKGYSDKAAQERADKALEDKWITVEGVPDLPYGTEVRIKFRDGEVINTTSELVNWANTGNSWNVVAYSCLGC